MIKFESEHDLEMMLYEHHELTGDCLIDDEYYSECVRQFNTKDYGICDLIYIRSDDVDESSPKTIDIHVVELKNEQIKTQDIAQVCRYKTFFDRAIDESGLLITVKYSLVVPVGIVKNGDACYMVNALDGVVSFFEFTLDPFKGIKFKETNGYSKVNEDLTSLSRLTELV